MNRFLGYRCSLCQREYLPDQVIYTCSCGGNLEVILDYEAIKKKFQPDDFLFRDDASLWRYQPLLPVPFPRGGEHTPLHLAGGTPILSLPRLAAELGLKQLWLKDESRNPTASFKDRASAVVVARAIEIKASAIITASTGNAGAALAGMAAAVGQKAIILAPKTAPPAKVAQLLVFGAKVLLVDGNYDDALAISVKASEEFGWYCRNTGYNPFTSEGKKTAAYEIWAQLHKQAGLGFGKKPAEATAPLRQPRLTLFVSVGDGNIISGIHKGFKDLHTLGWMEHMPRLVGVQAAGSAAVANAFWAGTETITPVKAATLADSIAVDLPCDGTRAVRAAKETGGTYLTVSDAEILAAIATLGRFGIFAEPAGAAALAGLAKARAEGWLEADAPALIINTGSGLKDIGAAMQSVPAAPIIEPNLEALKKAL